MPSESQGPPPGWYESRSGDERYWDGAKWTDRRRQPTRAAPRREAASGGDAQRGRSAERPTSDPLVRLGFVTAVLFPIVGFIIGIVLLARNKVRPGVGVLLTSVIVSYVACGALLDEGGLPPEGSGTSPGEIEEEINRDLGLVNERPKRARVGQPITLTRGDLNLRVQVANVLDPLEVGEYDEPIGGSDRRFVGVELNASNIGGENFDLAASDVSLLTDENRRATGADLVEGGDCPSDLDADLSPVAPGSMRRQCFPFEVSEGVGLSEVQIVVTTAEGGTATGIWSLG